MVFALIGPVVAIASVGDSRRRGRANSRREHTRFESELVAAIHAVDDAHSRERTYFERLTPRVTTLVSLPVHDPERWRGDRAQNMQVRLGTGRRESSIQFQGEPNPDSEGSVEASLSALRERAAMVEGAPITVDALFGIGVCGARTQSVAAANAILVQLAHTLSPMDVDIVVDAESTDGFDWVLTLPHSQTTPHQSRVDRAHPRSSWWGRVEFCSRHGGGSFVVAAAIDEQSLPLECRVVVRTRGAFAMFVRQPEGVSPLTFAPEFVSQRQLARFAHVQSSAAQELLRPLESSLVRSISLCALPQPTSFGRDDLSSCVAVDVHGNVVIDLVKDGPHAIVGGTTGSGKSEFLITWILAMASTHRVAEINFLLVDFKGGAAFSAVADLPHTVGMLTDLDERAAARAILSLRAEVSRRERVLAEANARSIEDLDGDIALARLVIVVDEFATLTNQLPELHELFADLAARGRSLGIHLILCTQRPAASVRDAVLANCSLRVSLRVTNHADSIAVVGTSAAAQLPRHQSGRALLSRGGSEPELVQIAMASAADIATIVNALAPAAAPPHRPWLDPLPNTLLPSEVSAAPAPALAFGLIDIPEEQRRARAEYDPGAHGNLAILGGHKSGKSTALAALAHRAGNVLLIPSSIEGAWDTVDEVLGERKEGMRPMLLLLDNVDELLGKFAPDYESAFVERLSRLMREGPGVGVTVALTANGVRGRLQALVALCESTLLLRTPTKEEHVLAGGVPRDFEPDLPPGAGFWRGRRVQIIHDTMPLQAPRDAVQKFFVVPGETLAVISSKPAALRSRLEELATVTTVSSMSPHTDELSVETGTTIVLGDPDSWQGAWARLPELRSRSRLVFHDCSLSDFRAITRSRHLPPPVESTDTVLIVEPTGRLFRAALAPQ